jgi:hypothetical protein
MCSSPRPPLMLNYRSSNIGQADTSRSAVSVIPCRHPSARTVWLLRKHPTITLALSGCQCGTHHIPGALCRRACGHGCPVAWRLRRDRTGADAWTRAPSRSKRGLSSDSLHVLVAYEDKYNHLSDFGRTNPIGLFGSTAAAVFPLYFQRGTLPSRVRHGSDYVRCSSALLDGPPASRQVGETA